MFSRIEEPPPDTMAPPATPLEEDQTRWEHLGIVALESDKEVDARYERVAEEVDDDFFSDAAKLPSRTPYLRGARMGRGAAFYNTFRVSSRHEINEWINHGSSLTIDDMPRLRCRIR